MGVFGIKLLEGDPDVCCCYNVYGVRSGFEFIYPDESPYGNRGSEKQRLGHSHSIGEPKKLCTEFTPDDVVRCHLLFGETILTTQHKVGCCPWKLIWGPCSITWRQPTIQPDDGESDQGDN